MTCEVMDDLAGRRQTAQKIISSITPSGDECGTRRFVCGEEALNSQLLEPDVLGRPKSRKRRKHSEAAAPSSIVDG